MSSNDVKIMIGTSGWSYPHWHGVFYPDDCPKSRFFEYYTQKFNAVEINATFYRAYNDSTYTKWRDQVPEGFKYVLKAPRLITHRKYLKGVENEIKSFETSLKLLGNKFGLILLQLSPTMPYDLTLLNEALVIFTDPQKVVVEFRNAKWFTSEVRQLLTDLGAVFCIADTPDFELMDWVTGSTAYIRLHGRQRWYAYHYSIRELEEIAEIVDNACVGDTKEVYVFFNNDFNGYAPKNASELKQILRIDKRVESQE